jgi:Na+/H+ antiporter NhaA
VHLLAVLVVDDLVAIVVIATVYSRDISWMRVAMAALVFLAFFVSLRMGVDRPLPYAIMGVAM